jgi:hypothetical protein
MWLTILFLIGFVSNLLWRLIPTCESCSSHIGLGEEDSRTSYHWDGKGKNPNACLLLCRKCAILHHEFWDSMWDDYNSSRF